MVSILKTKVALAREQDAACKKSKGFFQSKKECSLARKKAYWHAINECAKQFGLTWNEFDREIRHMSHDERWSNLLDDDFREDARSAVRLQRGGDSRPRLRRSASRRRRRLSTSRRRKRSSRNRSRVRSKSRSKTYHR